MKKVFISHGHNELPMHKLKDFVRNSLDMDPVVLAEQPDLGLTIVEKLEHYGKRCVFALILLTGDDVTSSGSTRARQNVIHELGYFHGLLGRKRVLLLKEAGVELFSNISGLIYKEFPAGLIESVFEDIRLAVESGDASGHAQTVPIRSFCEYTNEDWITAAIVGSGHAETELKNLAASLSRMKTTGFQERRNEVTCRAEARVAKLLARHSAGGSTVESRLDACIAKVVADTIQREIANFHWNVDEEPGSDPVTIFRHTVRAFIDTERNKWKK